MHLQKGAIQKGDKVLVRRMAFDGKHKIQDRFEEDVYTVIDKPSENMPVFKVESRERCRTLHRNLLFLIDNHPEYKDIVLIPYEDFVKSLNDDDSEEERNAGQVVGLS